VKNPVKAFLALRAFGTLVRDPSRINEIFNLVDSLVDPASLDGVVAHMSRVPSGVCALEQRPRLGKVDIAALRRLAAGTLGRAYGDTMHAHGLDHDTLPKRACHSPREYIIPHFYETHDIWHVVAGFHTDVAGELALQGFYAAQGLKRAPLSIISACLLSTAVNDLGAADERLLAIVRGWLLGKHAEPLFGIDWKQHWSEPLDTLRRRLRIDHERVDRLLGADKLLQPAFASA
jgi:ubiquinone biosynthesis protein COQ4